METTKKLRQALLTTADAYDDDEGMALRAAFAAKLARDANMAEELLEALESVMEWHEKCPDAGHRDHEQNAEVCGGCSDILKAERAIDRARGQSNE